MDSMQVMQAVLEHDQKHESRVSLTYLFAKLGCEDTFSQHRLFRTLQRMVEAGSLCHELVQGEDYYWINTGPNAA